MEISGILDGYFHDGDHNADGAEQRSTAPFRNAVSIDWFVCIVLGTSRQTRRGVAGSSSKSYRRSG